MRTYSGARQGSAFALAAFLIAYLGVIGILVAPRGSFVASHEVPASSITLASHD